MASTFTPTVLTTGSGGNGSASSVSITQASHGFVVGDWLYLNGSTYTKAIANSANTASVVGIVSAVADPNTFTLTTSGLVTGLTGLTAGSDYFLSGATAGLATLTEPTTTGYVSQPLGIAASTTSIQVSIKRSFVIGTSNTFTSITLANSATTTIQNIANFANGEGGVLTGTVVIDATTDYTFGFEISFTKDTAGVINHSVRYFAGDVPTLALFSVGISGQNIQMTLGTHTTFVSARARFQMAASAVSPSLQIDMANVTNGSPSFVSWSGQNGYGSTNTVIRKFTTVPAATGSNITPLNDATNGASFTVNKTGMYSITYCDALTVGGNIGLSKNSAQLTTNIASITAANRIALASPTANDVFACVSGVFYLTAGDVIRPHTDGGGATTSVARTSFYMVLVSN
jgi:hypothetical protein